MAQSAEEPQRDRPLREVIRDTLRARVFEGHYAPGTRLIERDLAAEFNVSRLPVREALRMLVQEGILAERASRGSVVASLSEKDVEDLFDVRLSLEVLACRLAAQRAPPRTSSGSKISSRGLPTPWRAAALTRRTGSTASSTTTSPASRTTASSGRRSSRFRAACTGFSGTSPTCRSSSRNTATSLRRSRAETPIAPRPSRRYTLASTESSTQTRSDLRGPARNIVKHGPAQYPDTRSDLFKFKEPP